MKNGKARRLWIFNVAAFVFFLLLSLTGIISRNEVALGGMRAFGSGLAWR